MTKTIRLSSQHISESTMEWLSASPGYIYAVPVSMADGKLLVDVSRADECEDIPADLLNVSLVVRCSGFNSIYFTPDEPTNPLLPVFVHGE
jgi:hypothetical protein